MPLLLTRRTVGFACAVGTWTAVACAGTSADDAEQNTPDITPDAGLATGKERLAHAAEIEKGLLPIAQAFCRSRFRCCTDDELIVELQTGSKDEASCAEQVFDMALRGADRGGYNSAAIPTVLQYFVPVGYAVDPKRVVVDLEGAAACALSLDEAACAGPARSGDPCAAPAVVNADPCALRKVYLGLQLEGDSCGSGWDDSSMDCAPGLVCHVLAPAHGVCLPGSAEGAECTTDYDCGERSCDEKTGQCVLGKNVGEACAFRNPGRPLPGTESIPCAPGLVCDPVALACATPACAVGCLSSNECGGRPCTDGRCTTAVVFPEEPGSPIGSSCSFQTTSCAADAFCDVAVGTVGENGTCRAKKPRGALCSTDLECFGGCSAVAGEPRCTGSRDGFTCTGR